MVSADTEFKRPLIVRPMQKYYSFLYHPVETILRVIAGLALVTHGWHKIIDPFGDIGLVERLGFYPGVLWSPALAVTEFFGGMLIAIGLLTRPAAFAAMFVLLVTAFFHWIVRAEGYMGAEKSILWAAIMLFFAIRGGNRHSIDARLGREF
jgi:putative oxidoreductase